MTDTSTWQWCLEDDVVDALNALPDDACVGDQAIEVVRVFVRLLRAEAFALDPAEFAGGRDYLRRLAAAIADGSYVRKSREAPQNSSGSREGAE